MAENKEQEQQEQQESNQSALTSMNYVLIGSAIGAGAGLLSSSDKGKKVLKAVGGSQAMRLVSQELTKSVQEMITEQAVSSMKKSISGYLNKAEEKAPLPIGKVTEKLEDKLNLDETAAAEDDDEQPDSQADEETENEEEKEGKSEESSGYEELKEENENLNERLDRIEEMLSKLSESKS